MEPVLYVNGFPAWSNGGRSLDWAPEDPQDYADFMVAAVKKYPQVRRWQVISEPGKGANFQPQGGGGRTAPRPTPASSTPRTARCTRRGGTSS